MLMAEGEVEHGLSVAGLGRAAVAPRRRRRIELDRVSAIGSTADEAIVGEAEEKVGRGVSA